jgi:hypothetical protein
MLIPLGQSSWPGGTQAAHVLFISTTARRSRRRTRVDIA